MHQIVCWLGLRPRPHWRSLYSAPPDALAGPSWFRGWGPGEREGGRGKRREGRGWREGRGREQSSGMP